MATTTHGVYTIINFMFILLGLQQVHVASTCTGGIIAANSGTVMCPSSEQSLYSNDMDVTWNLQSNNFYRIKFSKLDVELNYDKVHLYGDHLKTPKIFTLMDAEVVNSEFYIPGPIRINFITDISVPKSGFHLAYETVPFLFSVPTEFIMQSSGFRGSHPEFGTGNYSNDFKLAWSIHVSLNDMVTIEFTEFNTENNYDILRIYSGGIIPQEDKFSGNLSPFKLHFAHNVTLFFSTDELNVGRGFKFYFVVSRFKHAPLKINSKFHNWTGKLSTASSFSLQMQPIVPGTSFACQIEAACGIRQVNFSLQTLDMETFRPRGDASLQPCISSMVCTVQWRTESMQMQISLPQVNPETVRIELSNPELWSLSGVIQFRAVSDATCPSVRHQCELRTANESFSPAQLTDRQVSEPDEQHNCHCNITTHFSIVTPSWLTAGDSAILCRLNNGSSVEHKLPVFVDKSALTSPMERHLLLATSLTAVVSLLVTFGLACTLAKQSDCWRSLRLAREPSSPTSGIELTAQGQPQKTEDFTCKVYAEDTMESLEVYVV